MKTYLAFDSGGTKLAAITFDEEFRKTGACVSGSIRANTTPAPERQANMAAVIKKLALEGREIEVAGGHVEKEFIDEIRKIAGVRKVRTVGEADVALAAAGVFGDGILTIAGTGSTAFTRLSGRLFSLGGYGNLVSDEGSGYWIGRKALTAAIHDFEGRGPSTALTELIAREISGNKTGREKFRDAVFMMYGEGRRSPASTVAGLTLLVTGAAQAGDGIARDILNEAGRLQAEQVIASVNMFRVPPEVPVVLAGSVWRSNPVYFAAFCGKLREILPEKEVIVPEFEPVMGFPLRLYREMRGNGAEGDKGVSGEVIGRLKREFPEFVYDIGTAKPPRK